jgi:hypothetical protein
MNNETIEMEIDDLLCDLHGEPRDVPHLRTCIAGLILRSQPEVARRGTYWAKSHLVYACRAFNDNTRVSAHSQDNPAWLAYCLLQLRDAFLPRGTYNEGYTRRDQTIDRLTFEELECFVRREFDPFAA